MSATIVTKRGVEELIKHVRKKSEDLGLEVPEIFTVYEDNGDVKMVVKLKPAEKDLEWLTKAKNPTLPKQT